MASRRARRGDEQNLDSLLDTMANVTGILIVLLAVTQISMGDAMGRLRDLLAARPELTPASLEAAAQEADALRDALAPLVAEEEGLAEGRRSGREELAALRAANARLEDELADVRDADPQSLRDRARRTLGREQALRGELAATREELAELEARASGGVPLARDVKLPDPRPAPPGAREVVVLVRHGRAVVIDARALLEALDAGVARALDTPIDRLSLSLLPIHQRIRLRAHFSRIPVGSQGLRWLIEDDGREVVARLEWRRDDLGETADELTLASSDFARELRRTSPHRAFLRYLVWSDSFETYLAARRSSDESGFAAGFVAYEREQGLFQSLSHNRSRPSFVD